MTTKRKITATFSDGYVNTRTTNNPNLAYGYRVWSTDPAEQAVAHYETLRAMNPETDAQVEALLYARKLITEDLDHVTGALAIARRHASELAQ